VIELVTGKASLVVDQYPLCKILLFKILKATSIAKKKKKNL